MLTAVGDLLLVQTLVAGLRPILIGVKARIRTDRLKLSITAGEGDSEEDSCQMAIEVGAFHPVGSELEVEGMAGVVHQLSTPELRPSQRTTEHISRLSKGR